MKCQKKHKKNISFYSVDYDVWTFHFQFALKVFFDAYRAEFEKSSKYFEISDLMNRGGFPSVINLSQKESIEFTKEFFELIRSSDLKNFLSSKQNETLESIKESFDLNRKFKEVNFNYYNEFSIIREEFIKDRLEFLINSHDRQAEIACVLGNLHITKIPVKEDYCPVTNCEWCSAVCRLSDNSRSLVKVIATIYPNKKWYYYYKNQFSLSTPDYKSFKRELGEQNVLSKSSEIDFNNSIVDEIWVW